MKSAAVSKLKATLSEHLARVKAGEEVVVTERGKPIAKIVPLGRDQSGVPAHLLELAKGRGAQVHQERVEGIDRDGGRPRITTKKGTSPGYDLLVGAVGVNTGALKLFEEMGAGYRAPGTTKTYICELFLGEKTIKTYLGNAMHMFLLNLPRLEFAALIPKGDYVTMVMLGTGIDKSLVEAFFATPEVLKCFPPDWSPPADFCRCAPAINISAAAKPFADRLVLIGDPYQLPSVEAGNSLAALGKIAIASPLGARVPLSQLAAIRRVEGPVQIGRESGKRRILVEANVSGRDLGGFVAEAQERIKKNVPLPEGYYLTWGGQFENQQRAMKKLAVIVPAAILLIFLLLAMTFNSLRQATLVLLNLPLALAGGIGALYVSGQYLSVPAAVGFIALFGVAVLNGVVLVTHINQLRAKGMPLDEAIPEGCLRRMRPVLMTALITVASLVPVLFASGPGSEVQRPLAVVVIGGLLTSTVLTLLVLPALYGYFSKGERPA